MRCTELRPKLPPVAELQHASAEPRVHAEIQLLAPRQLALIQLHPETRQVLNLRGEVEQILRKREPPDSRRGFGRKDRRPGRGGDQIGIAEAENRRGSSKRGRLDRPRWRVGRGGLGRKQAAEERAQKAQHPDARTTSGAITPPLNTSKLHSTLNVPKPGQLSHSGEFAATSKPRRERRYRVPGQKQSIGT